MENLILAFVPFVLAPLMQFVKKLLAWMNTVGKDNPIRIPLLRVILAILSFVAVIVTAALSGEAEISTSSAETVLKALLEFFAATGLYFLSKQRANAPPAVGDAE